MGILQQIRYTFHIYKYYYRLAKVDQIARRYLVINSFDGTLTMFGILFSSYLGGIFEPRLVLLVGFSTTIAITFSGFLGSYMSERAERLKSMRELEKQMLKKLNKTDIAEAGNFASYAVGLVDGTAPLLASIYILSPFIAAEAAGLSTNVTVNVYGLIMSGIQLVYALSFLLCFFAFYTLGSLLGQISRENRIASGVRMVFIGLACGLLTIALSILIK
ncbi:hypothetical protein COX84_00540 [Candidatus Micrarchaeota archaeon CG_4_10_14_0_2_um_filter_49_7]|nr:MAG: hypothetical protein AUJ13_03695 [Candidatus Micrarchaeota archaeon CG1_02_49_24]PIZ99826.1 MAG: hypothetical protein COX84_00540 [Candidatus Micrarchaeota archaeon CG_4_10_14_0_2_um_filter_49_7]